MQLTLDIHENHTVRLALMYSLVLWNASSFRRALLDQHGAEAKRLQHELRAAAEPGHAGAVDFSSLSVRCLSAVADECATSTMTDVPMIAKDLRPIIARVSHALSYGAL